MYYNIVEPDIRWSVAKQYQDRYVVMYHISVPLSHFGILLPPFILLFECDLRRKTSSHALLANSEAKARPFDVYITLVIVLLLFNRLLY